MENEVQSNIPPVQPLPQLPNVAPSPTNRSKILKFILLGIIVVAGSIFIGIQFGRNQKSTVTIATTTPTPTVADPTPSIELNIKLPETAIRNQTNNNYSSWSVFTDVRGYKFNYPPGWFLSERKGEATQIQNWDSNKVTHPGPLSGNQSKWDIGFTKNNFQDISNILKEKSADMKVDNVEKSKILNGLDVYFIQGTGSFFGNEEVRVPLIVAIIVDNNQYFQWYSFYSGTDNAETLKQIVESINPTN